MQVHGMTFSKGLPAVSAEPTAGGLFSGFVYSAKTEGDGSAITEPIDAFSSTGDNAPRIGLGNSLVVYAALQLLQPSSDTDVKYVDVAIDWYQQNQFREQDPGSTGFPTGLFQRMEKISVRDETLKASQRIEMRWNYYRLPNISDPVQAPPLVGETAVYPTIVEAAIMDNVRIRYLPIAVAENENAVLRVGESIQFSMAWGAFGRTL